LKSVHGADFAVRAIWRPDLLSAEAAFSSPLDFHPRVFTGFQPALVYVPAVRRAEFTLPGRQIVAAFLARLYSFHSTSRQAQLSAAIDRPQIKRSFVLEALRFGYSSFEW